MAAIFQTTVYPASLPPNIFPFPSKASPATAVRPAVHPSFTLSNPKHHHKSLLSVSTTESVPSAQNRKPLFSSDTLNASTTATTTTSLHRNAGLDSTRLFFDTNELRSFLQLSIRYADIDLLKALHAFILKRQVNTDTFLDNDLVAAYLKLGLLFYAHSLLASMTRPDVVSFTAIISYLAKSGREFEAIELFGRMRSAGTEPNEYSFVALVTACIRTLNLELGVQVHAFAVKLGYLNCVYVANALMGLYGKCGFLSRLIQLFDEMRERDIASWNTVISCVVNMSSCEAALELFRDLNKVDGFSGDRFTLSATLTACSGCHAVLQGREVHAHAIRTGLEASLSVKNAIIGFYTKCGSIKDVLALFDRTSERDVITWTAMITAYMEFGSVDLAVEIFEKMPEKNVVSYNALLAGFCQNGQGKITLDLFIKMLMDGVHLTDFTLTSILNAGGMLMSLEISRQIHGFVAKFGSESNACIEAALLDMCTRCGRMKDAEKMFQRWPSDQDSSIIQTSMLCGYARNGEPDEAILIFCRGQSEGIMVVDEIVLTSVLGVCGTLGFREIGLQIHCLALKTGLASDLMVGNSIISMYSKCCSMKDAIKIFNLMPARDTVSWNGLIAGHLLHRQGDEALALWSRMRTEGIKPDAITLTLIVSAYKHTSSNLVHDCRSLFLSMDNSYDIEPNSEHYASLVGVLGYWGLLEEAEETIIKMPFEPEASVWRALLDSCRLHKNSSIGKRVAKHVLSMQPHDPSTFVLVSNLYSASGRWHCSETVREQMKETGLRKHPCRSWVIHDKVVHSFYVRDKSHPQAKDIYSGLDILILECLKAGYEPDTSFVLHEVGEQQKKDFLFYHSAKLAATYGLLMTRPGKPIQIVKNVFLCGDCHTFLKYVSTVTRREIHFRDTSGFHFFRDGQCSCNDYWCC